MLHALRIALVVLGWLLALIGVAGVADDIQNWGEFFEWLDAEGARWGLFVGGSLLPLALLVGPRLRAWWVERRPVRRSCLRAVERSLVRVQKELDGQARQVNEWMQFAGLVHLARIGRARRPSFVFVLQAPATGHDRGIRAWQQDVAKALHALGRADLAEGFRKQPLGEGESEQEFCERLVRQVEEWVQPGGEVAPNWRAPSREHRY